MEARNITITIDTLKQSAGQDVLCTTTIHTVTASFPRKLKNCAELSLVYHASLVNVHNSMCKPPIEPVPFSSNTRAVIGDDLTAKFKFKVNPLSSQHNQAQFRFCVTANGTTSYSKPFKTVTKVCRKKRKHSDLSTTNDSSDAGLTDLDWILDSTKLPDLEEHSLSNDCECRCKEVHEKLGLLLHKVERIEKRLRLD